METRYFEVLFKAHGERRYRTWSRRTARQDVPATIATLLNVEGHDGPVDVKIIELR